MDLATATSLGSSFDEGTVDEELLEAASLLEAAPSYEWNGALTKQGRALHEIQAELLLQRNYSPSDLGQAGLQRLNVLDVLTYYGVPAAPDLTDRFIQHMKRRGLLIGEWDMAIKDMHAGRQIIEDLID